MKQRFHWCFAILLAVGSAFQVSHRRTASPSWIPSSRTSTFPHQQANGWIAAASTQLMAETSSGHHQQLLAEETTNSSTAPRTQHRQRRYSLHHALHPIAFPDPLGPSGNSMVGLPAALRFMRSALQELRNDSSRSDLVRNDFHDGGFLRLETSVHDDTQDTTIVQWLLAQTEDNNHQNVVYMQTQHRTVAALGIAARYNGTNDGILPEQSVWYGAGRFDELYQEKDRRWETLEHHWILPTVELVRLPKNNTTTTTTLAVHVSQATLDDTIQLLHRINGICSAEWKNLPPILSRVASNEEIYEDAIELALKELLSDEHLQKVVLARSQTLHFYRKFSSLHVLRQLLQDEVHGVVFYIKSEDSEFWGATPEKLFDIWDGKLHTEALAGTRVRGSTVSDDSQLMQDLLDSDKDRRENQLTADFVESALSEFNFNRTYGVRRLRHLQHICQQYTACLPPHVDVLRLARKLWKALHPTPAVGGLPQGSSMEFLRQHEGWDRGLYAGPIGYLGNSQDAFLGVAIRSALSNTNPGTKTTEVQVFGGSGLVQGSSLHGEWSETNSKLAVLASLFPQSPVTLRSSPTPNVAWATAFCDELIRNGVTQFYICPGSRSTPLVVALVQAARRNPLIQAVSVHDERSAGFRAVGYARGSRKPAVVVTSSGTAVANLYPAVVEAGMDGLPMILLTADRPYENRATGANQAIDQVKIFSSTYVRWFRDILPPSDDIPVSAALSDACHAVSITRELRGPVHLNVQFRENLAPDKGPIRNDNRQGSTTVFNGVRYTDVPGFDRWSSGGQQWSRYFSPNTMPQNSIDEVASLIQNSRRGIILVGGLRQESKDGVNEAALRLAISDFAEQIGFPIVAGAQSAALRFQSSAVIPFAEHIFRSPAVRDGLDLDLVIQIGWPVVSTAVPSCIANCAKEKDFAHVLVHPHSPGERLDSDATVTHRISASPLTFLLGVADRLRESDTMKKCFSELYTMVGFGRQLQGKMKEFITKAGQEIRFEENLPFLTEPELMMDLAESFSRGEKRNLFLSSSMPVRDAEMFLYRYDHDLAAPASCSLGAVACNRGASGIDGVIASALGFAEAARLPTTLLIGDLATVHDLGSLYSLREAKEEVKGNALTTIVVNNNGGGIFSFLPIAQHKRDVDFDTFFATPTEKISFDGVAGSVGLSAAKAKTRYSFPHLYKNATSLRVDNLIEATVLERDLNVRAHSRINEAVQRYIEDRLLPSPASTRLSMHQRKTTTGSSSGSARTLLLLHGWMGSSLDWEPIIKCLTQRGLKKWNIVTIDLAGHGRSPGILASADAALQKTLGLRSTTELHKLFSIDGITEAVEAELLKAGIESLDAVAGYSAGGRVALSLSSRSKDRQQSLISDETQIILIGADPFEGSSSFDRSETSDVLEASLCKESLKSGSPWSPTDSFIQRWYEMPMWGVLQKSCNYKWMAAKRVQSLQKRGSDLLEFFRRGSGLSGSNTTEWLGRSQRNTLFLAGSEDLNYVRIGKNLESRGVARFASVEKAGHALVSEFPQNVASILYDCISWNSSRAHTKTNDSMPITIQTALNNSTSKELSSIETPRGYSDVPDAKSRFAERNMKADMPKKGKKLERARENMIHVKDMSIVPVSFSLVDGDRESVQGIGWGEAARVSALSTDQLREGFIVEMKNLDGTEVGLGEVTPLRGVHKQTRDELMEEARALQRCLSVETFSVNADEILQCTGQLENRIQAYTRSVGLPVLSRILFAGLEMAILSLAAELTGIPLHQALMPRGGKHTKLAINGLITRQSPSRQNQTPRRRFQTYKVKVGHQPLEKDQESLKEAFRLISYTGEIGNSKLRIDANRAWTESQAIGFATALEGIDVHAFDKIEFIEEPLQLIGENVTLEAHVDVLERSFRHTGIPYALDESIAELAEHHNWNFEPIRCSLVRIFSSASRGCAAFVLKPTVLGFELSLRLARFARSELGMSAVFSSCFESGLGLAHVALLAYASDLESTEAPVIRYSHGLGTFVSLSIDTLAQSFGSYVDDEGNLNVAPISRSLFGLSVGELNTIALHDKPSSVAQQLQTWSSQDPAYEASTAVGPNKEINVVANVRLPFSVDVAFTKFTDLPAMSRWSPWIENVRYDGNETEWTINIRGVPFRWRAASELVSTPNPGIQWRSVSGIENCGTVEFVGEKIDGGSCRMNVDMKIVPPRLLRPLFQNASVFLEDFLRDKLLKWSLEMFRDTVKADMALERGDIELGDALIGAVEGKATAIEETLGPRRHKGSNATTSKLDDW